MQVYFMYVKMWHYTTRTHSHMYSLILCMNVCMYAMPCHAMHVCMLEHVGTHVCSALFSHMHMKYTSVCGGQSATGDEFWYTTITTVWFERERRDGEAQLQRSGGSAAIVSAFSSLGTGPCCGSPRMGPCFPLRATHAVYWWSWCNLLLCKLRRSSFIRIGTTCPGTSNLQ
jgi:hypothetical protein